MNLAGLAPLAALWLGAAPMLTVSPDGRTATWRTRTWTAPEGASFFQRGERLHLVSLLPGQPLDLEATAGEDGELEWPSEPRVEFRPDGSIRWRAIPAAVARLVQEGQLYPHEEHLHVSRKYQHPDFQALWRAREDESVPALRRNVAIAVAAMLVEEKLPSGSDAAALAGLARLDRVLAKLRRGFEAGLPATALGDMLAHDFEIRDAGKTLEIDGATFRAATGVRFGYCSEHFHVEDTSGKWAAVVPFGAVGAGFRFPAHPLYAAGADGTVVALPGPPRWRALLDAGQIQMLRDHWHLTPRFSDPSLDALRRLSLDPKRPEAQRAQAGEAVVNLLLLKLDLRDAASFDSSLASVRSAAAFALAEVDRPPTGPKPPRH